MTQSAYSIIINDAATLRLNRPLITQALTTTMTAATSPSPTT